MNIHIDSHTHSVASGHAFSTVDDLARGAQRRGLKAFVLTDHGPAMPGTTHPYHFGNLRVLPKTIQGVRFFTGIEANIMNTAGEIDLEPYILARLDFVMAGFHEICFEDHGQEENTEALVNALRSPWVDAISHPGNPAFPIDMERVVATARDYGKALEINDSSFRIRKGSHPNCLRIAQLCIELGCPMVCGSDAHYWEDVGRFDEVQALLAEVKAPENLVLNSSLERFEAFSSTRRAARHAAYIEASQVHA
ncbi:phosphatase [Gracilinema caldarium]|uniref:PHP domain protein n=1 Tax=Gracilinema caldarium (strain ATCC 51460 / DSM 7334 / H1) TaxID=744872 RepID=F8F343_GRAC1|nr:phosphatase [Gracilinema caldarium]AEJ20369.1 PHP domain protein [Gracilinema caldarium DSM 7334]